MQGIFPSRVPKLFYAAVGDQGFGTGRPPSATSQGLGTGLPPSAVSQGLGTGLPPSAVETPVLHIKPANNSNTQNKKTTFTERIKSSFKGFGTWGQARDAQSRVPGSLREKEK